MNRRIFLKSSGLIIGGASLGITTHALSSHAYFTYSSQYNRPAIGERKFVSPIIEKVIDEVKSNIGNEELAILFENCFPNTLDTTVKYTEIDGKPDTFVITGDIPAMWLRDSSAQVHPYVQFINEDESLRKLIAGVINRQTKCILFDPYANAFNENLTGSEWENDLTDMKPGLHERKWEIDSLCYPVRLAHNYWKTGGDVSCFDDDWLSAVKLIIQTFREQQRKEGKGPYKFQRLTTVQYDTVAGWGYGNPVKPVGLICSMFRPSDDATIFPFLIPSNLFAVSELRNLSVMLRSIKNDIALAEDAAKLAFEIENAVFEHAIYNHPKFGKVFAYEIDGFGNMLFMDDANIPGLLSLPYLGAVGINADIYVNTRKLILSESNPYFFKGKFAEGIGGPHIGLNMIWPMSIIMRSLTSLDDDEIKSCLYMLMTTHAGTGFMHESFHKDDPNNFTRKWFAWANTLFGELILHLKENKPYLLT